MKIRSLLKQELLRYKYKFFVLSFLQLVTALTTIVTPYIIGVFTDALVMKELHIVRIHISEFTIISVIYILCTYETEIVRLSYKERVTANLTESIIRHLQRVPILKLMKKDSVSLGHQISMDAAMSVAMIADFLISIIVSSLVLIASFGVIFTIKTVALVPIITMMIIYVAVYFYTKDKISDEATKFKSSQDDFFSKQTEQLTKAKLIKENVAESFFLKRINESIEVLVETATNYAKMQFKFEKVTEFLTKLATIVLFVISGVLIVEGDMTVGSFITINTYYNIIMNETNDLSKSLAYYRSTYASLNRMELLLRYDEESGGKVVKNDISIIEVKDINFSYDTQRQILHKVSARLEKGRIYLVKGKNGYGKSTFLNVVSGLYQKYSGTVCYDDVDIRDYDCDNLRKNLVTVVEQEVLMINGTIWENITLGIDNVPEMSTIRSFFDRYYLEAFMEKLNAKTEAMSGGEKQKIAIIRALIRDTPILIMDEPTTALDEKSIESLRKNLIEIKDKKIILIVVHGEQLDGISDEIIEI